MTWHDDWTTPRRSTPEPRLEPPEPPTLYCEVCGRGDDEITLDRELARETNPLFQRLICSECLAAEMMEDEIETNAADVA